MHFHEVIDFVPGKDTAEKLTVFFTILGGLAGLPFFYWVWQKLRKSDIDSIVGQVHS